MTLRRSSQGRTILNVMFFLLTPILLTFAAAHVPSATQQSSAVRDIVNILQKGTDADGCVATSLACNTTTRGRLAVGDCTFSADGTYFDTYTFSGAAGKLVFIDMRVLSPTMTNPSVIIVPPTGDASKTPWVFGRGAGVSAAYVLSSSGTWAVGVGTRDLFATGDYFLSIRCAEDDNPALPQNCIDQSLLCGQTAAWYLTSQSCRFTGGSSRLYAGINIYAVAGDVVSIEESSTDFRPLFGLYDSKSNLLASSTSPTSGPATLLYSVPVTGFYGIAATSANDLATGFFTLRVTCSLSGCLEPLALAPLQNATVPYGGRASLTFDVSATEPLTLSWTQVSPNFDSFSAGRTFLTPPLFHNAGYYATASNPCGTATSTTATVIVRPPRQRPARH